MTWFLQKRFLGFSLGFLSKTKTLWGALNQFPSLLHLCLPCMRDHDFAFRVFLVNPWTIVSTLYTRIFLLFSFTISSSKTLILSYHEFIPTWKEGDANGEFFSKIKGGLQTFCFDPKVQLLQLCRYETLFFKWGVESSQMHTFCHKPLHM